MTCPFCGWPESVWRQISHVVMGEFAPSHCKTYRQARDCLLNKENLKKYNKRNPHDQDVWVVRSIRHQNPVDGKGDSSERLEKVLEK
jgi:hypothetical protein